MVRVPSLTLDTSPANAGLFRCSGAACVADDDGVLTEVLTPGESRKRCLPRDYAKTHGRQLPAGLPPDRLTPVPRRFPVAERIVAQQLAPCFWREARGLGLLEELKHRCGKAMRIVDLGEVA